MLKYNIEPLNILHFLVKTAEAKVRCTGKKYRKNNLWFDEECMEKKMEMKEALRKIKEKDDDESILEYWESRKAYERTVREQEVYSAGKGSRVP
jgi:hypothetical protein